jgi:hypothetical protein
MLKSYRLPCEMLNNLSSDQTVTKKNYVWKCKKRHKKLSSKHPYMEDDVVPVTYKARCPTVKAHEQRVINGTGDGPVRRYFVNVNMDA